MEGDRSDRIKIISNYDAEIPSEEYLVGIESLMIFLDIYTFRLSGSPIYRGENMPPRLLYILAPLKFGVGTTVMNFCRKNGITSICTRLTASTPQENIKVLTAAFKPLEEKKDERFMIYLIDPMYAFRCQEGVCTAFLNLYSAMLKMRDDRKWSVVIRSPDIPTHRTDHMDWNFWKTIDVVCEAPMIDSDSRKKLVRSVVLNYCFAPLEEKLVEVIADRTTYMGAGEIVSKLKTCFSITAEIVARDSNYASIYKNSTDYSLFLPSISTIEEVFSHVKEKVENYGFELHPEIKLVRRFYVFN